MTQVYILNLSKDLGGFQSVIHPVLLKDKDELILFDTGYPGQADAIEDEMNAHEFSIADLTKIIISHHDHDHIGSLQEIKTRNPDVQILASAEEEPYISGKVTSMRLQQAEEYNKTLTGKEKVFGEMFASYLKTINPCPVDQIVNDSEMITGEIQIIKTPGHTPGHISLFLKTEKIFIAGDSLAAENNTFAIANPQFTLNMPEALASVKKIMTLNAAKIICYHGGVISTDIHQKLAEMS